LDGLAQPADIEKYTHDFRFLLQFGKLAKFSSTYAQSRAFPQRAATVSASITSLGRNAKGFRTIRSSAEPVRPARIGKRWNSQPPILHTATHPGLCQFQCYQDEKHAITRANSAASEMRGAYSDSRSGVTILASKLANQSNVHITGKARLPPMQKSDSADDAVPPGMAIEIGLKIEPACKSGVIVGKSQAEGV
jgi:hypothetical protein